MSFQGMSAILLFAFAIPIVMQYRILPIDGTPYWLFGILFFLLIGNTFLKFSPSFGGKLVSLFRKSIVWIAIGIVLGGSVGTAVVDRHKIAPVWQVHDIILQQEAAIRYFVKGKNPYKETYFGTPVESFHYDELGKSAVNPALYHFVMPPLYLLFPLPFYYLSNHTLGYFDGRIPLFITMIGILIILRKWFKDEGLGEIAIIFAALSPATVNYFIEGRSDIFALFWLILSIYLLDKKKYIFSSLIMGLALISKQTIWFAYPFWIVSMYVSLNLRKIIQNILLSLGTAAVFTLPFLVWNGKAFLDSVVLYLSAGGPTGYPVSGYGFSMILYEFGFIKNLHDYYPFLVWQLGIGLPILFIVIRWYIKKPKISRLFMGYGLFLFVIWYFSRYFNNSHIAFISSIFMLGVIKYYGEQQGPEKSIHEKHKS